MFYFLNSVTETNTEWPKSPQSVSAVTFPIRLNVWGGIDSHIPENWKEDHGQSCSLNTALRRLLNPQQLQWLDDELFLFLFRNISICEAPVKRGDALSLGFDLNTVFIPFALGAFPLYQSDPQCDVLVLISDWIDRSFLHSLPLRRQVKSVSLSVTVPFLSLIQSLNHPAHRARGSMWCSTALDSINKLQVRFSSVTTNLFSQMMFL